MTKLKLLLCSFLTLTFFSCNWDNDETGTITGLFLDYDTEEPAEGVIFTLSALGLADTTGVDGTFKITDITPGTYYFKITSINDKYYSHTDYISVSGGRECECMYTIKKIEDYLILDVEEEVTYGKEGGVLEVEYSTNVEFEISIDEECDWLTYEIDDEIIVFYVDANDSGEGKSTVVQITCPEYPDYLTEIAFTLLAE